MNNRRGLLMAGPGRLALAAIMIAAMLITAPGTSSLAASPAPAAASAPSLAPEAGLTCVTYQPAGSIGKDAYIKQEKVDERRGTDPELRIKTETNKLSRALLQFSLTGLPSDAVISSATLSLWVKGAAGGPVTINAHQVIASWNETEVTWNARDKAANLSWTAAGGDYKPAIVSSTVVDDTKNVWRSWNLTSLVALWKSDPSTNLGVILEAAATNPKTEKIFKSSDDGTALQRPKLEVCYTSGLTLTPNNSSDAVAGITKTYAHVVRVGNLTTVVNLSASSSQGWPRRIYRDVNGNGVKDPEDTVISATPSIGPNADYPILVQVDVPAAAPPGAVDTTTVTATAVTGGATATATNTTRVGKLITVAPNYDQYATAGSVVFYGHTVVNNGDTRICLNISAASSLGWTVLLWEDLNGNGVHETSNPAEPPVANPVCLNAGQSYKLVAEVRVPAAAAAGNVDQTTVKAALVENPVLFGAATDLTRVFVNQPPVVDGRYDDVYSNSPNSQEVCYVAGNTLFGKLATYYQPAGDAVYMVLAIDKDFVDNTYGTNAIGWPGGHDFSQLVGSDRAQFYGYDVNDTLVLDFELDYISAKSGTPSGYDTLGLGGDGGISKGLAANIQQFGTSLSYSLNQLGYCSGGNCSALGTNLLVNSPATDNSYSPNDVYPDWIYDVIYEVKIAKAAFPAGFGSLEIPYIHASPSKIGTNTIYAEPGPCPGEIGDFVWYDANHDGVQDLGEPGIANVQLKLYNDNGDGIFNAATDTLVATTVTNAAGRYLFQNLPADDYFVDVTNASVPAGYVNTTFNDPTPRISLAEGQRYLDADFGYVEAFAEVEITKEYTGPDPLYPNQEFTIAIRIHNSGFTTIDVLPLQDWYDTNVLDYLGATPASNDNVDDGVLNWSDLTVGFGRNLAPGETFEVVLRFKAVTSTTVAALLAAEADAAGLAAAPEAAPDADPVVDGRLDASYSFLRYFPYPANDAPGNLYGYQGANACYWALVVDRAFNSNVYAESDAPYLLLDGWNRTHKFGDLLGSDNAKFNITYPGGSYTGLGLDYLNGTVGNWSSGQTGKDGSSVAGTPPISAAATSLHWNLLNSGWTGGIWGDPLKHSPAYDYNSTSGRYWEWQMIYEFSIPKSLLGNSCGEVTLASAHNSPAKNVSTLGRIGDRVWEDQDLDNVQDSGEVGLPGVVVNLYQNNALVRTTVTEPGASGYYIFNNLAAGTYVVNVDESTLPAGYSITGAVEPRTVTLPSGGSVLDADFGYYFSGSGSIGDRVFYDLNGDGLPDNDPDPGLNGVKVLLYRDACAANGALLTTQTTAGNGNYLFTRLPAGAYCVRVDETTLPPGVTLTTGNEPLTVNLAAGQAFLTADFGYRAVCVGGTADLASVSGARDTGGRTAPTVSDDECVIIVPGLAIIGDRVWIDTNANGIQDPGEIGLPDVQVDLYNNDGLVASTTTDANGIYQFTDVPAGVYYVVFNAPDGYIFSPKDQGSDDARDSDPNDSGTTDPFTVIAGQDDLTRDAGLYPVANLGDFVWYDGNGNGIQDGDEPGIPDVTVKLYNSAGGLVNSIVTDADGYYLFEMLTPGDYCIEFVAPAGLVFTRQDQGGNDALDSDANPATGRACTTLSPGENDMTVDAGLVLPGAIGDFVWYDADGDGIEDVGEPGIPNVTLDLIRDGVVIASTVTDADGGYLFPNLPPATYTVDVTDLYGKLAGLTHIVANQSLPDPYTLNLGVGEINKDVDFGYVRVPVAGRAIIGDTVWYDADGDGFQQPGEPGIPGIQVCATPAAGGTPLCATTDSNGRYLIEVPAGTYNVAPTNPPGGYTATTPVPHPVTVTAGQQYLDADFGYDSPNLGRIGNLVFLDSQNNGVFDAGDRAFAGVSVDLIRDTNGNRQWDPGEPIIATVTTGSTLDPAFGMNGNYLFTAVPTGNYLVHVSDTNAVLTDYVKARLGTAGADNNNQADPYPVSLPAGGTNLTADFGYTGGGGPFGDPEGAIGNQVWIEIDGDGIFDPEDNDFGQPGVTVELYKDGEPYAMTTTGASGRYAFLRLPAGNYSVFVTDLADVLIGYSVTKLGPNPGQDNNNQAQPYVVVLPEKAYDPTADFGYILPGAIGDYVWYDTNADGTQDVGEPGLGNVTVALYRDNGNGVFNPATDALVGIETTGADGGYLFTGLPPAVYFVDVTDRNGMLNGLVHTLGPQSQTDPTPAITLASGQIYRDADFGYVAQPGSGKAIIGDTVWYDGDGDGVRDPGEPGIPGIQVCATPLGGGQPICDITNENGQYLIEVPGNATYTVAPVNPPAGYTATTPVPHGPITVSPGDQYLDADFGYDSPALGNIGGTVWHDTDEDGLLDPTEPRIPGVSVDLYRDLDGDGLLDPGEPLIATVTTDQNGDYLFQGLPPGKYLIVVSDTQNVLDDFQPGPLGPNPGQDNNNQEQPYAVNLPSGGTNTTADFGYVLPGTNNVGIIGNQVWYEEDGNGLYNPGTGDIGIAGVTVALYRNSVLFETTTTGAGGDYVFTSLPAGSYTVRVTDAFGALTSYVLTVLGPNPGQDNNHQEQPYAITLPPAGINMTADFGYTRPGAIGDFVWYDSDRDGIQDIGEPGIPNVTLNLIRGGAVIASTVTDADGGYLFPNLPPGAYVVDVTDLNNKLAGLTHLVVNQSQPDPTAPISLAAGEAYKDADFGYVRFPNVGRAIIGDTVWYDENGDGIQQPGEIGIPGIQVCATPVAGGSALCAITDSNGLYRIEVPAGSYNVAPTNPPGGYTATTPVPHPVTVVAGQQYLEADFGYDSDVLLGRIGNLVFLDPNRDGRFTLGDSPLAGVSVALIRDTNGNQVWNAGEPVIATTTTSGILDTNNGNYLFPGVPGGAYLVHVSDTNAVLTDYAKSPLGTTGVDNNNQADPYPINLASGASNLTADFGYYRTDRPDVGVIGNQVWIEKDGNGLFNPTGTDIGQAGVTVELFKSGQPYAMTTTGASGDYSFIGLPAGVYTVTVTDDFGVLTGYAVTALGPQPGLDNNNQQQPYQVALPTAGYNLTADFGYIRPRSSIGDTVFFDDNRSGAQDGGEVGIPGIIVKLYTDGATACDTLVGTQTTDSNGRYLFVNLPPAHYCVVVPQSENPFLSALDFTAGTNPHVVNLAADQNYLDADFGYAGRGIIRGQVYYDWNQDQVRGLGEGPIPNVQVCLYADANGDGIKDSPMPITCTTTDASGNYSFDGLLPGTYIVEQTVPGGLFNSTPIQLNPVLIVIQGAGLSDNNNFGNLLNVRLGDFVWIDTNSNGIQDPGETTGLSGVPIRIVGTDIINRPVDVTILTSAGLYLKTDLIPGTYTASAPDNFSGYTRTSPATRTTTLTTTFIEDLTLDFGYAYPTAVQVQEFTAQSANSQVTLSWVVLGNALEGFRIWRADNVKGIDAVMLTETPITPAGDGQARFTDTDVVVGQTYYYWLEYIGDSSRIGPASATVQAGEPPKPNRIYLPLIRNSR